jgi:hypothetical protein
MESFKKMFNKLVQIELIILKYYILWFLKIAAFLTSTSGGQGILLLMAIALYGLPFPFSTIIALFLADLIGVLVFVTIFAQFEKSRNSLKDLIGPENFSKYVGDNSGSISGRYLVKTVGFILCVGLSKVSLDLAQDRVNDMSANTYADRCRQQGIPIDAERFHKMYDRQFPDILKIIKPPKK